MFVRKITNRLVPLTKNLHTTRVARCEHDTTGIFGSNLMFPVGNRYVLSGLFLVFAFTGYAIPVYWLRYAILKQS